MNFKIKFVIFSEDQKKFIKDDNEYIFELDEEFEESYTTLEKNDKNIYNFFKNEKSFLKWIKEEVYPDYESAEIGISFIDDISYLRFWFFKVESGDAHYEYFMDYFSIFYDDLYDSRAGIGEEIVEKLKIERKGMVINLDSIVIEEEIEVEVAEEEVES